MHFPPDTNRPQFSTDPHIVINQVYVFSSFYYLSRGHNMDVHCHIYSPVRQTSAVTHKEFEFWVRIEVRQLKNELRKEEKSTTSSLG